MYPEELTTSDTLFNNELCCIQHEKGYRFSIDSIILAHFVRVRKEDRILDLGAGCGVAALIVFYRNKEIVREISGIEIQKSLSNLAKVNYNKNKIGNFGRIYNEDIRNIRTVIPAETYDAVICNPPFYKTGTGRKNQNDEARIARHQIHGELGEFLKAAFYGLKNRGAAFFIYPAESICDFICLASKKRLEVKRMRFVYSYPNALKASLVLAECVKNGKPGADIMEPLYVYKEKNGGYSDEMEQYYKSNGHIQESR